MSNEKQIGGGSAAAVAVTSSKKKSEIHKPEKVLREGLQKKKEIYESEGWRFTEHLDYTPPGWLATNPSPVFPNLRDASLAMIFSYIENLKNENGELLRKFIENQPETFMAGGLPDELQEKKESLEAGGWQFDYDSDKSEWSAVHENYTGARGVSDIGRLFGIIENNIARKSAELFEVEQTAGANVVELSIKSISVSEFSPQWHRRRRFKPEDLSELAESIKNQGLINPITVRRRDWQPHLTEFGRYGAMLNANRPDWVLQHIARETEAEAQAWCDANRYEIIAGERRFEAAKLAGLDSILCFVKDLTDQQALEIQMQENLQRVDVHPLDEAAAYKFLMDQQKMTAADLQVKFGKNEKYIALRLKLNNLIPEAVECISEGYLSLGHAIEVAKFDTDRQPEVLKRCFDTSWTSSGYQPDKTKPLPLREVLKKIAGEILLDLNKAPFSIKDKRLRADGLTCVKCPERTGAKNSLFEEYHEDKNDRCLNPTCFGLKTTRFVQITRDEATAKSASESQCPEGYKIPVIAWQSSNKEKLEATFTGEEILVDGDYFDVSGNECEAAVTAVFLDSPGSWRFGRTINICRDKTCEKHSQRHNRADSSSSQTDNLAEKLKRKQEIFDVKVGEAVRHKVLAAAAASFSADKWIYEDERWLILLINRLWNQIDSNARAAVTQALGKPKYDIEYGLRTEKSIIEYFTTKLTSDERSRLLFLCIVANYNEMLYGTWKEQTEVKQIAEEFGVDYQKLDAAERLLQSPKKYMALAQDYFNKVERGEEVQKPIFYKPE